MDQAFVSLVTNDNYSYGAEVLGKSLKQSETTKKCVLMVTSGVSDGKRELLKNIWDELIDITALESNDRERLAIMARPELGCTFTKIRAWTLTQFKKCVFLDADTLVIQNVDDLFEREELSAAPDIGWPDCFNTGVFVFAPSMDTYSNLIEHAKSKGSFDGGDQGLLNEFFNEWSRKDIRNHLPFVYNMVANVSYSYTPAFMRYGQNVKIVHFLGAVKPWHHYVDERTGTVKSIGTNKQSESDLIFNQMWWDLKATNYPAKDSSPTREEPENAPTSSHPYKAAPPPQSWQNWEEARVTYSDQQRSAWERGSPDYQGQDRFDNILSHMKTMMLGEGEGGDKDKDDTKKATAADISDTKNIRDGDTE